MRKIPISLNYLIFLFWIIIRLPYFFYIEHPVFVFLEQPLTILLPTLLISYFYIRYSGFSIKEFYRLNKITLKEFVLLTIMVFLFPAIVGFIVNITVQYVEIPDFGDFLIRPEDGVGLFWEIKVFFYSLFYGAIFPGICEEFLFRGSILKLSEDFIKNKAFIIFLNALLFGIFHMNLIQLFYTFALGLIFAKVVMVTDSIFAGIYIHALYNFIIDLPSSLNMYKYPLVKNIAYFLDGLGNNIFIVIFCIIGINLIIYYMELDNERKKKVEEEEYLEDI